MWVAQEPGSLGLPSSLAFDVDWLFGAVVRPVPDLWCGWCYVDDEAGCVSIACVREVYSTAVVVVLRPVTW